MKSTTPICDLTAVARERLSGNWGKSIGVLATYLILLVGEFASWRWAVTADYFLRAADRRCNHVFAGHCTKTN